ncbi:hypothetical protein L873DRAFT_1772971 [Choiromyces venosus 120613-1]|uniref:Glycine zipper domain-containing protein n=1 Tax=Choiromyces venosus 120613-1 TaxID=1336337 RepID=A0A3N4JDZ1_9PEZI|nr:hypothetical protein L873DRAFT_1772971 [Choiromyces venosus 120613-1]
MFGWFRRNITKGSLEGVKAAALLPIAIRTIVKEATPALKGASRASRAILPITLTISALTILAAENRLDELANQVCSLGLGTAGAAIGSVIGAAGGPIGMIIGAGLGGFIGGWLGEWGYKKFKTWFFTEDEDGVRPIDRIANALKQATDKLKALTQISAIIIKGQNDALRAMLLMRGQRRGGEGLGMGGGKG